jgi:hypothetical protein
MVGGRVGGVGSLSPLTSATEAADSTPYWLVLEIDLNSAALPDSLTENVLCDITSTSQIDGPANSDTLTIRLFFLSVGGILAQAPP